VAKQTIQSDLDYNPPEGEGALLSMKLVRSCLFCRATITFILGLVSVGSLFGATPTSYSVTIIPLPAGQAFDVYPMGINNAGQVVGFVQNTDGSQSPFIGTGAGYSFIPVPSGCALIDAQFGLNINDSGQIVASVYGPDCQQPVIGTIAGFTLIPLVPTSTCSSSGCTEGWDGGSDSGINNSGQVAGSGNYYYSATLLPVVPFIGNVSGVAIVPVPAGWEDSAIVLTRINNSGQVVGYGYQRPFTGYTLFVGNARGIAPVALPSGMSLFYGAGSYGAAIPYINNAGRMLVTLNNGYPYYTPYIGTANGLTPIPPPAGCSNGQGYGINDLGQIVGGGYNCSNNFVPFVGTASGTANLNTLVPSGWEIVSANAINNKGQIAAAGFDPTGVYRALILTPDHCLSFVPSSLTFPGQTLGTTSAPNSVTATNVCTPSITISNIATSGDFASPSNTCSSPLAQGNNCTVSVTFTPTQRGNRTGGLIVTVDAPGSPQTVPLTGTGLIPGAKLTPKTVNFGTQLVETSSPSQAVTLTNTGNQPLDIAGIAATGPFSQSGTCGSTLAAQANCAIFITFDPSSKGPQTGTLGVTDDAPGSPQTVSLKGTGTVVELSPASLSFGSQTVGTASPSQAVTLTNTGSTALKVTIGIGGTNPGDFNQTNNCGAGLKTDASCTITVTFTPTATGARSGTVSVSDSGGGSPQTVVLTGTGM